MSAPSSMLSFRNVSVRANRNKLLLNGVNLDFADTGLHGIIGPNGAGKSSLVRTAIGLLKASSGEVILGGRTLSRWPARELAAHIGYVPQQIFSYWNLSVAEMLRLRVDKIPGDLIERCQIGALLERRFATLSGGEQARVAIARALAHQPRIVFADEPAAHLDMPHQHLILRLLREYAAKQTVLVVLHDLHLASRYCDRVALFTGGKLVAADTPVRALKQETLDLVYGVATTQAHVGDWTFYTVSDAAPSF